MGREIYIEDGSLENRPGVFLIGSPNVGKRTLLSRNVDFIGAAHNSDPTVQLSHPPPPFYAPTEYITQLHIDIPSRHGERIVEVPLSGGGTVNLPLGQGLISIDTSEVLSNDEWRRRYQESASREALLRQFIISSTVLRDNVLDQPHSGHTSVERDEPSSQPWVRPSWEPWSGQSSQQ